MKNSILRLINEISNKFGYTVKVSNNTGKKYDTIYTSSLYSPWNTDDEFISVYNIIKENTLVDVRRCYEMWELMEQTIKLQPGIFLEVGVWRGGTGILMAKKLKYLGDNSTMYLADTFTGVVKTSDADSHYTGGEHADTSLEHVEKLAKILGVDNIKILKGIYPEDTGHEIKDMPIRFCHIDVDVYESAKDIVLNIWENLVGGGIIVFDDYGFKSTVGINTFVNEQRKLKDRLVFYNLNGHAIIVKL